jgi:calcineurin-like phosphoesterase family protein
MNERRGSVTRFFTSDQHFGHVNIIQFCGRPARDIDEMNELIIDNWNNTVGVDDEVWVLGDFALGKIRETLPLVGLLNGTKHLIAGNHDRCWHGHKKGVNSAVRQYLDAGFTSVEDRGAIVLRDATGFSVGALLNHFPYTEDARHADRYSEFRPVDNGSWLIHGHVHTEWLQHGRQINVGTDVWGLTPASEDQIVGLIKQGPRNLWS